LRQTAQRYGVETKALATFRAISAALAVQERRVLRGIDPALDTEPRRG
jgi:hypothetical protein